MRLGGQCIYPCCSPAYRCSSVGNGEGAPREGAVALALAYIGSCLGHMAHVAPFVVFRLGGVRGAKTALRLFSLPASRRTCRIPFLIQLQNGHFEPLAIVYCGRQIGYLAIGLRQGGGGEVGWKAMAKGFSRLVE